MTAWPAIVTLPVLLGLGGCGEADTPIAQRVVGGDGTAGRAVVMRVGCGACHEIPGILGAHGIVGPSLRHFARRSMIGGVVANQPGMLVRWVREAPALAPDTAMPSMPITENEARDVAAYLYTLR
ncbi:MAG: c-type cytochrome [Hyphomicrobiaceae bacterium]|nr:c-type cytochrome [Hyphomicrobiaceae bacterium]